LAKSSQDASWSGFLDLLREKAQRAGHVVIRVPARFTTQRCSGCSGGSGCGDYVQKRLSVRTHLCPSCGLVEDRAVNAARNILQAGASPSGTGQDTAQDEWRSPAL